jgi:fibronectin type 3 domain-containing protein
MYQLDLSNNLPGGTTLLKQNSDGIDLTSGNRTQNLQVNTVPLNVTVKDAGGSNISSASVYDVSISGSTTLYSGDSGEDQRGSFYTSGTTNGSGVASLTSIVGLYYGTTTSNGICATVSSITSCNLSAATISGSTNVTITMPPAAPTSLSATSPTYSAPHLTWAGSTGATSYNIYRGGTKIDSTTSTSYNDRHLTGSTTYSYYVKAVSASGESAASNTISVNYTGSTLYNISGKVSFGSYNPPGLSLNFYAGTGAPAYNVTTTTNSSGNYSTGGITNGHSVLHIGYVAPGGESDSTSTGITEFSANSSGNPTISADTTQDFSFPTNLVTITARDKYGNLATSAAVWLQIDGTQSISATGDTRYSAFTTSDSYSSYGFITSTSSGAAQVVVLSGLQYKVCTNVGGSNYCAPSTSDVTVTGNTTAEVGIPQVPSSPTGLSAPSPTTSAPALTWNASTGATTYYVYRSINGGSYSQIGSTSSTSYTDTTAVGGGYSYSYYVKGSNSVGLSLASNTIGVSYL